MESPQATLNSIESPRSAQLRRSRPSPSAQSPMSIGNLLRNDNGVENFQTLPTKTRGRSRSRSPSSAPSAAHKLRRTSESDSLGQVRRDSDFTVISDISCQDSRKHWTNEMDAILRTQTHLDSNIDKLSLKLDEYAQSRAVAKAEIGSLKDILWMMNQRLCRLEQDTEAHQMGFCPILNRYATSSTGQAQGQQQSSGIPQVSTPPSSDYSDSEVSSVQMAGSDDPAVTGVAPRFSSQYHGRASYPPMTAHASQSMTKTARQTLQMNTPFWPSEVPSFPCAPTITHLTTAPYNTPEYAAKIKSIWPRARSYFDISNHASRTGVNFERAWTLEVSPITTFSDQDLWFKLERVQSVCDSEMVPYRFWGQFAQGYFRHEFASVSQWIAAKNPTWLEVVEEVFKAVGPEQHALCTAAVLDKFDRQVEHDDGAVDVVDKLLAAMRLSPPIWSTPAATLVKAKVALKTFVPELYKDMVAWEKRVMTEPAPPGPVSGPTSFIDAWADRLAYQVRQEGDYSVWHGGHDALPIRKLPKSESSKPGSGSARR